MSKEVTLTLSNELYEQAQRWATLTRQELQEALTDALSIALAPGYGVSEPELPVASLSDEQVLSLCDVQMGPEQGNRLSYLLKRQREGALSGEEQRELQALMQVYNYIWVRQSQALAEATKRGLRGPLAP
jgi:ParB-like chromosome segregation protein Spo0J